MGVFTARCEGDHAEIMPCFLARGLMVGDVVCVVEALSG